MNSHLFEKLEFDKILSQIASLSISPLGEELISTIRPLIDLTLIQQKLSEVTELREIIDFDDPFPIDGLKDIRQALKKVSIVGSYLLPEELLQVSSTLGVFRRLNDYFKKRQEKYPILCQIAHNIGSYQKVEKEIARCIDPSTLDIYDRASPNLLRIRKSIAAITQKICQKTESLVTSLSQKNYLQENVITIRDGRLVLMVKDEYKNRVKGIVHDQSATGATLFIEPMETLELSNQIRALKIEEKREIEKILNYLAGLIREEFASLNQSLAATAQFDFIYAKAQFSAQMTGYQPHLNTNNVVEIIRGRHPLLLLRKAKAEEVIPLDLKIGDTYNTLIITGPNAGGKTVALKTVGLLSLMTQCGIHVPVDPSSDMCIFHNIFSVIGDEQSIENDLSTFSSHVEKLKFIVDHVTHRDLVIIDEIGTGTDPEEGAALAIAILENLTKTGSINIVSTHQGALKAFAHETEHVENGSMEFNAETFQPTYRFRLGLPGSSYAFDIAKRYGLSEQIIDRSRQLVGEEKHRLENLLIDLENKMLKYQAQLDEISFKQSYLDNLIHFYQEKKDALNEHEKRLKLEAIKRSEEILNSANVVVEHAIKEIREKQASREAIKIAKQQIEAERKRLIEEQEKIVTKEKVASEHRPITKTAIGQAVLWKNFETTGIILSEADASNKVLIDTGVVKVKIPVSELEEAVTAEVDRSKVNVKYDVKTTAASEIDLRGLRAEEALAQTDKFIEEALLAGLSQVYIIHGKGTGTLRQVINQFLDKHPHIKSKRLADWNQGGTGVTVVELK